MRGSARAIAPRSRLAAARSRPCPFNVRGRHDCGVQFGVARVFRARPRLHLQVASLRAHPRTLAPLRGCPLPFVTLHRPCGTSRVSAIVCHFRLRHCGAAHCVPCLRPPLPRGRCRRCVPTGARREMRCHVVGSCQGSFVAWHSG